MYEDEIRQASDYFYYAVNQLFKGDLKPLDDSWSHAPDVTLAGPFGVIYTGWDEVRAQLERESKMGMSGQVMSRDLIVHAVGDLGYTVCIEEGQDMSMNGKPIHVSHRATSIYRREYGFWKLVHHHSDRSEVLIREIEREEAAVGSGR